MFGGDGVEVGVRLTMLEVSRADRTSEKVPSATQSLAALLLVLRGLTSLFERLPDFLEAVSREDLSTMSALLSLLGPCPVATLTFRPGT